jgi:16S rRNA (adenine1518-N6/adenine1519-N6)-dimethyltransferase
MPHKLGQVFLHDPNIISKIVEFGELGSEDHVIEIGCGHGAMTGPISQKVNTLDVVEIDEKCIATTREKLPEVTKNITFHHADILEIDLQALLHPQSKVIGNIPYYISAKIIKKLMTCLNRKFSFSVLMVQKEFAKKLRAQPGDDDYTSLTIYVQNFFDCDYGFTVSKNCFSPIPKVDSAVIKLTPKQTPLISELDHLYFKIINSAFWGRRKPLVSALKKSPYLNVSGDISTVPFFTKNPTIRGERLSAQEFYEVYQEIRAYL